MCTRWILYIIILLTSQFDNYWNWKWMNILLDVNKIVFKSRKLLLIGSALWYQFKMFSILSCRLVKFIIVGRAQLGLEVQFVRRSSAVQFQDLVHPLVTSYLLLQCNMVGKTENGFALDSWVNSCHRNDSQMDFFFSCSSCDWIWSLQYGRTGVHWAESYAVVDLNVNEAQAKKCMYLGSSAFIVHILRFDKFLSGSVLLHCRCRFTKGSEVSCSLHFCSPSSSPWRFCVTVRQVWHF